jgi:hypothetical protein
MKISTSSNRGRRTVGVAACSSIAALLLSGCVAGVTDSELNDEETPAASSYALSTALDRPATTSGKGRLRVASWNTDAGSVFPRGNNDPVWSAINKVGKYQKARTTAAARIFNAVDADIWLLQETAYDKQLPSGVTVTEVNNKISAYMNSITGKSWNVSCEGRGLCMMARGNINLKSSCLDDPRNVGYLVELNDWNKASLVLADVHYKDVPQSTDTKNMMTNSKASAKYVAGDFNDVPGGDRYNEVASIPGIVNIEMKQAIDIKAPHLKSTVQNGEFKNTKGYVAFENGSGSQALVSSEKGGHIDHIFLGSESDTWKVKNKFTLNTLLLSKGTLNKYGLKPTDVALLPDDFAPYFTNFLTNGTIKQIPGTVDHDHLPMIVDLEFPNQAPSSSPSLKCP